MKPRDRESPPRCPVDAAYGEDKGCSGPDPDEVGASIGLPVDLLGWGDASRKLPCPGLGASSLRSQERPGLGSGPHPTRPQGRSTQAGFAPGPLGPGYQLDRRLEC